MSAPVQLSRKKVAKNPNLRWDALNQFCAFAEPADLTPVQKAAWLTYWYDSLVETAGHAEYFAHLPRPNHDEVLAALRTVGASDQAAILAAARDAVTSAATRAPDQYSDRYLAGVDYTDFEPFDQAFQRCPRPVTACLMDYLDKHETDFIQWLP